MKFENEKDFEVYLRNLIQLEICAKHPELILLDNKKVADILICRSEGRLPSKAFFIEIKYHKKSHGRLGFGSASGVGFQPEIISKSPDYFENNLKWVLAEENPLSDRMLFVSSHIIRRYVSGGTVGDKFNNIQKKIFRENEGLKESDLVQAIERWLIQA